MITDNNLFQTCAILKCALVADIIVVPIRGTEQINNVRRNFNLNKIDTIIECATADITKLFTKS